MNNGFLTPLRFEKIGAQRWLLLEPLVYRSESFAGVFVVPRGFQTDLASIPRVLWVIAPKVDIYDQATVLHDCAYANALTTYSDERVYLIKEFCDALFLEALRSLHVNAFRAQLMYLAVKRFGNPAAHPLAAHSLKARI
jgi:hypothetical protein